MKVSKNEVNIPDSDGCTPLIYSCLVNDDNLRIKLVRLLLECGADPNIGDDDNNSPMIITSVDRDLELLKMFIEQYNGKVDITNYYEETPLFLCSQREDYRSVKFLLKKGANPNIKNVDGLSIIESMLDLLNDLNDTQNENCLKIISKLFGCGMKIDFDNLNQYRAYLKYQEKMLKKIIHFN